MNGAPIIFFQSQAFRCYTSRVVGPLLWTQRTRNFGSSIRHSEMFSQVKLTCYCSLGTPIAAVLSREARKISKS